MKEIKNTKKIEIKLLHIKELSFSCNDLPTEDIQIKIDENLKFAIGFNFNIKLKEDLFYLRTIVKYEIHPEIKEILSYENEIAFKIKNLSSIVEKEKDKLKVKDSLMATLLGISIGTIRGMLAVNTLGKNVNKYPLPLLNPIDVINTMKKNS